MVVVVVVVAVVVVVVVAVVVVAATAAAVVVGPLEPRAQPESAGDDEVMPGVHVLDLCGWEPGSS